MIFSEPRDPRLITVRRGGTLSDSNHHLLALWAAACAEHVLHFFEEVQPADDRPRHAIEQARAWARGEITMSEARTAAGHARCKRGCPVVARGCGGWPARAFRPVRSARMETPTYPGGIHPAPGAR